MYTQNLAHKFSGNSSWSYQKYLFQVHVFAFFSEAQCLIPSYKTQCYLKTTLNSCERTKPVGKLLRGRLLLSKLAVTLPNPHKNVDTSTEDGQKGNEGGRHQPACGAAPLRAHLPASPMHTFLGPHSSLAMPEASRWGQKWPVVARPSLGYLHNYSPTADFRILCSWIQGICCKTEPGGN